MLNSKIRKFFQEPKTCKQITKEFGSNFFDKFFENGYLRVVRDNCYVIRYELSSRYVEQNIYAK